jgi:adenine phosphoribosyltransferase
MKKAELYNYIRDIPDFPKPGIIFKDITPLLKNEEAFKKTIDLLVKHFRKEDVKYVVSVEARGFIFGSALAYKLGAGFIPVRKKGKLPYKTTSVTYELEYGTDTLEHHEDAFEPGDRILVIDDVLATGGTVKAVCDLVLKKKVQIVGLAFLMELKFLKGRNKLKGFPIYSLLKY